MKRTFIKPILVTFLFNSIKTEEYKDLIKFKEDVGRTDGPNEVYFESDSITKEDLTSFDINRPLESLSLIECAVDLLKHIDSTEDSPVSIKKLYLDSDLDKPLEEEQYVTKVHLTNVEEIEGHGIGAIKEILSRIILNPKRSLRILKLVADELIEWVDIKDGPSKILIFDELKIEGMVSPELIKKLYEERGEETKTISIELDRYEFSKVKCSYKRETEVDPIKKRQKLKKVALIDEAILLTFSDYFKLFDSKVETIVLKANSFIDIEEFESISKLVGEKVTLIDCNHIELHDKSIFFLPLISDESLTNINWIGIDYTNIDVKLIGLSFERDESEAILKENILEGLKWYEIMNKEAILVKTPVERLRSILGISG
eukprot:GHVP01070454.1.p1 GENE.GHVP01070454.1~~GHVP01070454.1.p1  ORF type:complete len:373 (-),score=81.62 GHVP01070454.1:757-1875(-)